MSGRLTRRVRIVKHRTPAEGRGSGSLERDDALAVEEPLEIRVGGTSFSVTMRSPGDDFDLVAGFLVGEGIVWSSEQLVAQRYCAGRAGVPGHGRPDGADEEGLQTYNVIDAALAPGVELPDTTMERHVYTSSSCGICGSASIDAVHKAAHFSPADDDVVVAADLLASLPDRLREHQQVFGRTGGVHAAGLFTADGELLCLREDVGRHNAVDKVVGWALREDRLPLRGTVLQLSGRVSFELAQKAHMAGVPVVSAVSAPSSLAVEHAASAGLTVVAFNRGGGFNAYTGHHRIS